MIQLYKSRLIILLIAFVLSGCVQFPKKSGYSKLRPLCEKDAGLTIHKTVQAKGYFDPEGWTGFSRQIIFNKFEFVEFCTEKSSKTGPFYASACWRVSKVDRAGGQCAEEIDQRLGRYVDEAYGEFLKNSCFSVEKIERPMSRYSYHSKYTTWSDEKNKALFGKAKLQIKDRKDNRIIAEYTNYSFSARPGLDPFIHCGDVNKNFPSTRDKEFVNSVIFPKL